jgi:hypothetical protein
MERNKLTIAILVSTYALIIIALHLSSTTVFPIDTLNADHSESQNSSQKGSKCWSPPGKTITKQFLWQVPTDWTEGVYPLCYEKIELYYWNCTSHWVKVDVKTTDENGYVTFDAIPGKYYFSWPDCGVCSWDSREYTITCEHPHWDLGVNYVDLPKGGDRAFLFFRPQNDYLIPSQLFLREVPR